MATLWERATKFPKVELKTQDDKTVELYDDLIKGKIVILNFFYTTCDGQLCDRGTKNLVQVQKALGDRFGQEVVMYSITIDPKHDTPDVLKHYAEDHGAKWTFLTGELKDITALRQALGLSNLTPELRRKLELPEPDSSIDQEKQHSGMIVIGNDPAVWLPVFHQERKAA